MLTANKVIKNTQNTKNVPAYQTTKTRAHQIISQTTFARFRSIFRGAEEALESISVRFFFSA
jgi:hypothetical protein